MVSVVVGSAAFWTEMMLFEIKKFPPDLDTGQVEEMPYRLHLHAGERPVQSDKRILKNIVRRLPSLKAGKSTEHLSGEFQEPVTGMIQEQGFCAVVAGLGEIYQPLELGV